MMVNRYIFILIALSLIVFFPLTSNSQPNQACVLVQITDSDRDSRNPEVCGDGSGVLFASRADLLNNGHPNQVDLFFADLTNPFSPVIYQLTNTSDSDEDLSISDDCQTIAFSSRADYDGMNPGGQEEIFTADISDPNNPVFTQITPTIGNSSIGGKINGDGTKVAFSSSRDFTGMNGDGSREYFIFDSDNGGTPIGQLTSVGTSGSISNTPLPNANGSRAVFSTTQNFVPPGQNANGGKETYLSTISYDVPNAPITELFQITNLPSNDFTSDVSDYTPDGNYVLFSSNGDITGMNPAEAVNFFLVDVTAPAAPAFTQLTKSNSRVGSGGVINASATSIVFITSNPDFSSADNPNLVYGDISDPNNPNYILLTKFGPDSELEDLAGPDDLSFVAFESESSAVGNNPDESEEIFILFTQDCGFAIVNEIPTLSEWALITMAGILGIVAFFVIRRRQLTA